MPGPVRPRFPTMELVEVEPASQPTCHCRHSLTPGYPASSDPER